MYSVIRKKNSGSRVDDGQSKEENDHRALQYNFIFFAPFYVKLSFLCATGCFT
jgi:hypothetical protein